MFCKKCGKYVQPTEKQCPYCGEIMEDTVNNQADNGTGNASEDFGETKIFDAPKEDFGETKIFGNLDIDDDNVEEISKIEEKLNNMKRIDKTIFLDFYYSSKSIKDIAKEQKISEFSVKQRLYRIRNKIRKEGK